MLYFFQKSSTKFNVLWDMEWISKYIINKNIQKWVRKCLDKNRELLYPWISVSRWYEAWFRQHLIVYKIRSKKARSADRCRKDKTMRLIAAFVSRSTFARRAKKSYKFSSFIIYYYQYCTLTKLHKLIVNLFAPTIHGNNFKIGN